MALQNEPYSPATPFGAGPRSTLSRYHSVPLGFEDKFLVATKRAALTVLDLSPNTTTMLTTPAACGWFLRSAMGSRLSPEFN
jgi:hypothetical protein